MSEKSEISLNEYISETDSIYGRISYFKNDLILGRSLKEYGEWAQREIQFLSNFINIGGVVVDAGAFIGTHSLAFSSIVGDVGMVHSFEPHPWYFSVLKRNINNNGYCNLKLYNYGLSDHVEIMCIAEPDLSAQDSFGSTKLLKNNKSNKMIQVSVKTLDDLSLSRCDLIKADVEGMEVRVLEGSKDTIERCQPIIYTECNSANEAWPVVLRMRALNYKVYLFYAKAFNPNNYLNNELNIFGEAMELGLLSIPVSRLTYFKLNISQSTSLIPINTLDDLVLCLLKKPQYKHEVLMQTSGITTLGKNFWLNEVELGKLALEHSNEIKNLLMQLSKAQNMHSEVEQVALERAKEIGQLRTQLDMTQLAHDEVEQLALERAKEIGQLRTQLDMTQLAHDEVEQLALERAKEIGQLTSQLDMTQLAHDEVEQLALERAKEIGQLTIQLDMTQLAHDEVEQLALERAKEIGQLATQLDMTQLAHDEVEQLALERAKEIGQLTSQLDMTQLAHDECEQLAFDRAAEIIKLTAQLADVKGLT